MFTQPTPTLLQAEKITFFFVAFLVIVLLLVGLRWTFKVEANLICHIKLLTEQQQIL